MDEWMNGWMDGWMDEWMDGWWMETKNARKNHLAMTSHGLACLVANVRTIIIYPPSPPIYPSFSSSSTSTTVSNPHWHILVPELSGDKKKKTEAADLTRKFYKNSPPHDRVLIIKLHNKSTSCLTDIRLTCSVSRFTPEIIMDWMHTFNVKLTQKWRRWVFSAAQN